ncbi:MAG: hypothetical protein J3Q66DRAFT_389726 [Benniella sp.]|nr:MAG: hypothetical protein J3Q66DRAFT_389726 [Benniella sp.]
MANNGSGSHSTPEKTDCLVCGSGKSLTKNQILFCDGPGCDIPVHQNCYGVAVVPEGNWYCQRCEDRIPVNNTPRCCCPQKTGAFKRTTIPNQYIHVACARLHPCLNENFDPINFNPSLANKQICCLCQSDFGLCSKCSVENCPLVMHVTCAQRKSLMTKGKEARLFCSLHQDVILQRKALKKQEKRKRQLSMTSGSAFHRSTKNGASYRELSSDDEEEDEGDDDDDDDDDDMEEDEDDYRSDSDDQVHDRITLEKSVPAPRRRNTSAPSSGTVMLGSKGHIKSARSLDATDRRRKDRSPESEEIEVDDTEAVLGSSALGAQRKKFRTGSKESPAESQRRRLLMNLDKKKRQGSTGSSSANNLINMPIRILGGGVAVTSSTLGNGPTAEPKQKLPGISRYNNSTSNNPMDTLTNPYAPTNDSSPPVGSMERLSSNGHQSNGRGVGEGPGKAMKGVGFDADPVIDASNFKAFALGSATSSPTTPNFSNAAISQNRVGDKQKRPSRPGPGALTEDSKETQATIQALTEKVQQLQQQLAANNAWGSSSSSSAQPGDSQEKARNRTLRQNLRDLFGVLQLPVAATDAQGRSHGDVLEYNPDRLDEYVQALRDTVVRSGTQDAKRRNLVADRVLKELADMDVC